MYCILNTTSYIYIYIYIYILLYTLYCTLYTICCTLYTIYCVLYIIHYTLCTIHYTLYTIYYILYTILYTIYYGVCGGVMCVRATKDKNNDGPWFSPGETRFFDCTWKSKWSNHANINNSKVWKSCTYGVKYSLFKSVNCGWHLFYFCICSQVFMFFYKLWKT